MSFRGLVQLQKRFEQLRKQAGELSTSNAIVGYAATYHLTIHEDLSMPHNNGQAKYLEEPVRTHNKEIFSRIADVYKETGNANKAMMAGARLLKSESQALVPVDTGALRASAYACLQENHEEAASAAYDRAVAILGTAGKRMWDGRSAE